MLWGAERKKVMRAIRGGEMVRLVESRMREGRACRGTAGSSVLELRRDGEGEIEEGWILTDHFCYAKCS